MIRYRRSTRNQTIETIISVILLVCTIGFILNFQNIWEYWPESNQFVDISMQWIVSAIGVVVPPLGVITGLIF